MPHPFGCSSQHSSCSIHPRPMESCTDVVHTELSSQEFPADSIMEAKDGDTNSTATKLETSGDETDTCELSIRQNIVRRLVNSKDNDDNNDKDDDDSTAQDGSHHIDRFIWSSPITQSMMIQERTPDLNTTSISCSDDDDDKDESSSNFSPRLYRHLSRSGRRSDCPPAPSMEEETWHEEEEESLSTNNTKSLGSSIFSLNSVKNSDRDKSIHDHSVGMENEASSLSSSSSHNCDVKAMFQPAATTTRQGATATRQSKREKREHRYYYASGSSSSSSRSSISSRPGRNFAHDSLFSSSSPSSSSPMNDDILSLTKDDVASLSSSSSSSLSSWLSSILHAPPSQDHRLPAVNEDCSVDAPPAAACSFTSHKEEEDLVSTIQPIGTEQAGPAFRNRKSNNNDDEDKTTVAAAELGDDHDDDDEMTDELCTGTAFDFAHPFRYVISQPTVTSSTEVHKDESVLFKHEDDDAVEALGGSSSALRGPRYSEWDVFFISLIAISLVMLVVLLLLILKDTRGTN